MTILLAVRLAGVRQILCICFNFKEPSSNQINKNFREGNYYQQSLSSVNLEEHHITSEIKAVSFCL